MTEIEFLVQLLLTEPLSEELKVKLLTRIGDVEKYKVLNPYQQYPAILSPLTFTVPNTQCQHDYDNFVGDGHPPCKKCGQVPFTGTLTGDVIASKEPFILTNFK
jgi:hypothetical protein